MKENARIEAFSDGVFAIAITLLILEIKVPPYASIQSVGDLWKGLYQLWPSYFAFVLSFGIILVSWVNHHYLFNTLGKSSRTFLYANGFLLLTITFMPFPTALLAQYIGTEYAKPAIAFYCFGGVVNSIGWMLLLHSVIDRDFPLAVHADIEISPRGVNLGSTGVIAAVCFGEIVLARGLPREEPACARIKGEGLYRNPRGIVPEGQVEEFSVGVHGYTVDAIVHALGRSEGFGKLLERTCIRDLENHDIPSTASQENRYIGETARWVNDDILGLDPGIKRRPGNGGKETAVLVYGVGRNAAAARICAGAIDRIEVLPRRIYRQRGDPGASRNRRTDGSQSPGVRVDRVAGYLLGIEA